MNGDIVYKIYKASRIMYDRKIPVFPKLLKILSRIIFSCEIPYQATIGANTSFAHHGLAVVIHPKAQIGRNCKILHSVTIGGRGNSCGLPIIGDNVVIGAGACILGDVRIGDNIEVGAGAVVITDIPENCTAVGIPAKIMKKEKSI